METPGKADYCNIIDKCLSLMNRETAHLYENAGSREEIFCYVLDLQKRMLLKK